MQNHMKKLEFLFVPNNLIKMITKEMKHFCSTEDIKQTMK